MHVTVCTHVRDVLTAFKDTKITFDARVHLLLTVVARNSRAPWNMRIEKYIKFHDSRGSRKEPRGIRPSNYTRRDLGDAETACIAFVVLVDRRQQFLSTLTENYYAIAAYPIRNDGSQRRRSTRLFTHLFTDRARDFRMEREFTLERYTRDRRVLRHPSYVWSPIVCADA